MGAIRNVRLSQEEFDRERRDVLASWRTGAEVDLDEAIEYQKGLPRTKVLATLLREAEERDAPVLICQEGGGRATLEEHIELLRTLQESGSDYLPSAPDSHTREHEYAEAERGLEESKKAGRTLLNGFPLVAHGVKACRSVIEAVDKPVLTGGTCTDPRLQHEVAYASGFTVGNTAAIRSALCYSRDASLPETIRHVQYCDRLMSVYEEHGAPLVRVAPTTGGTDQPASLKVVLAVLNTLLAAEQGVRHILGRYSAEGSVVQSVAGIRVEKKLCREYLNRFGYRSAKVYSGAAAWQSVYPPDEARSYAVVCMAALVAVLSGARVFQNSRSVEEAFGLPSIAGSAATVRAVRQMVDMLKNWRLPETEELREEMHMIELESRLMIERVLELGDGDIVIGVTEAFRTGEMDMAFSPNRHVLGKVMIAKDCSGAVRYLDCGNLPFTQEIKEFHHLKLAERGKREGRVPGIEMTIDDLMGGTGMLSRT